MFPDCNAVVKILAFGFGIPYTSLMFRKTASALALLAAFQMMGGHWIVLQSIAWSQMLVQYSQESGFFKGAEKTFDGDHPCHMCHEVRKEVSKENSNPISSNLIKLLKQSEVLPPVSMVSFSQLVSFQVEFEIPVFRFLTRTDSPLTPPPLV